MKILVFFCWESFFRKSKMDKINVQKWKTQNTLCENMSFVTIIEN